MAERFGNPIDAQTRYCGVYGHPVRHSASPAMQNAGLAALGLNWRYLAFEVPPEHLAEAVAGAKAMGFVGLNLTVPHKVPVLACVDVLDPGAREWGAVNTIRFEARAADGTWRPLKDFAGDISDPVRAHGFNTDAEAVVLSLREDLGFEPRGASVLVLGAGGAGRVAALRLAAAGVGQLYLVNRTRAKAEAAAQEIRGRYPAVAVEVGYARGPVDLCLNATSLGLKPGDALPWEEREFPLKGARLVYDMIYRPAETPLLLAARAAGCRVANGLGMLLYQGVRALELWTGASAPVEVMRQALRESVYGI